MAKEAICGISHVEARGASFRARGSLTHGVHARDFDISARIYISSSSRRFRALVSLFIHVYQLLCKNHYCSFFEIKIVDKRKSGGSSLPNALFNMYTYIRPL